MQETFDRQSHWEIIYTEKDTRQVSWYQAKPQHSIERIAALNLAKDAHIIDIGAGDSRLPDNLLLMGYHNISVLDISAKALEKAKARLADDAQKLNWIASDVLDLSGIEAVDLWHDRAAFHFLKEANEIKTYAQKAGEWIKPGGYLLIATFSVDGPLKCSGLEIQQYSEASLNEVFVADFEVKDMQRNHHQTPSGGSQEFLFGLFKRRASS